MYRFESNDRSDNRDLATKTSVSDKHARLLLKRAIDIFGALLFMVIGWPLYLAVALSVKLTSKGPVHFCQIRVGKNGEAFRFYKFRSMEIDAERKLNKYLDSNPAAMQEWDKFQKLEQDPRITPLGAFIRKTSLDELPQFWNVLKGEMSLVGPRPVTHAEKTRYGDSWGLYCSVRPGLTGLWQVSGRSSISYEERVRIDEKYINSWSVGLDIKILVKTVYVVLLRHGSS